MGAFKIRVSTIDHTSHSEGSVHANNHTTINREMFKYLKLTRTFSCHFRMGTDIARGALRRIAAHAAAAAAASAAVSSDDAAVAEIVVILSELLAASSLSSVSSALRIAVRPLGRSAGSAGGGGGCLGVGPGLRPLRPFAAVATSMPTAEAMGTSGMTAAETVSALVPLPVPRPDRTTVAKRPGIL